MKTLLPFLIIILTTLSCGPSHTPLTSTQREAITAEVKQTLNNYYADIKRTGLTAELQYLDSSSDFFWMPPGYLSPLSYYDVVAVLNTSAPLYKSVSNSWDTLIVKPLTAQLASYTGRLHSVVTDTTGKVIDLTLAETGIMIRRETGWKLLSGQTCVCNR